MKDNEASFSIKTGYFTRFGSIPLKETGFAKELAEDVERVMDHYNLKHQCRELKEKNEALEKAMGDAVHHMKMNRKEVAIGLLEGALRGV